MARENINSHGQSTRPRYEATIRPWNGFTDFGMSRVALCIQAIMDALMAMREVGLDGLPEVYDASGATCCSFLTTSGTDSAPSFRMAWDRWIFTVTSLRHNRSAICLFIHPSATSRMTSRSRGVSNSYA